MDDRPENILEYAGTFFDRAELRDIVEAAIEQEKRETERNEHLNNLIKGKTLISWNLYIFYSFLFSWLTVTTLK